MSRIGVLVVDDSVVVRRMVSEALSADPALEVLGTAPNGQVALNKLDQLAPDCVVLDIDMPVMDGLETLRRIRVSRPHLPVVMFSTLTERGASATLDALALGASDYLPKPAHVANAPEAIAVVRAQLAPKIVALCGRPFAPRLASAGADETVPAPAAPSQGRVDVIVIGASTGGPGALETILPALPADLPVPVLVVQHMPPMFTRLMAERLDKHCALDVREAAHGSVIQPGQVLIAPGDRHLTIARREVHVYVKLTADPPENFCRPAVGPLFRTAAEVYGPGTLALVLTGMGNDGRRGSAAVYSRHGRVLAQDAASSTVWGMPGAVVGAGLADRVLPLDQMADVLLAAVADGRSDFRPPAPRPARPLAAGGQP
jgi:two-component system chemotaxis response regulator CheB